MAKHYLKAAKPSPKKPKAELRAAPTWYEISHPVGSAERFLDEAAKEALASAAVGGVITPRQAVINAAKAITKEELKYPDPLLAEAAKLPTGELMKRAARAEAAQKAMHLQNQIARATAAIESPIGKMATTLAATDASEALQTRQAAKGGDVSETPGNVSETPGEVSGTPGEVSGTPGEVSTGPRIVINPTTFKNSKDALCVAFNEGFRLWMEAENFEPQSEPTDAQRKFFSDTAYADDEVQLRRTILARIATFDTSVKDPTDDQLAETGSFLDAILESDWCKNEWERNAVSRLSQAVKASVGAEPMEPKQAPLEARSAEPLQANAAMGGGETDDDEEEATPTESVSEDQSVALYNEDGSIVEQDIPSESYSLAYSLVSDGTTVNYNADGSLQENANPSQETGYAQEPDKQAGAQEPDKQAGAQEPDKQAGAQEPAGAQGEADGKSELGEKRNVLHSGVWSGGAEGSGRELTAREAEFMRQRIESGASVNNKQLAMFGLSRNSMGTIIDQNGDAFAGFGDGAFQNPAPASIAKTDDDEDKRRKKRFTMNGPALTPKRKIGDIGNRSLA